MCFSTHDPVYKRMCKDVIYVCRRDLRMPPIDDYGVEIVGGASEAAAVRATGMRMRMRRSESRGLYFSTFYDFFLIMYFF